MTTHRDAETHFAPAARAAPADLEKSIQLVSHNPVIDGVLRSSGGLVAILNSQRQILTLNHRLLDFMGIDDPGTALGMRVGEAVGCVHAHEMPGGCGTTEWCSTCGQVVATMLALQGKDAGEHRCALRLLRDGAPRDLCLRVEAQSIEFDEQRFVLVHLQDISQEETRAALERSFFHDLNNTIQCLVGVVEWLATPRSEASLADARTELGLLIDRLVEEIAMQRALVGVDPGTRPSTRRTLSVSRILGDLARELSNHPALTGKTLQRLDLAADLELTTDVPLLSRVLTNMIVNAAEDSRAGEAVKLWVEHAGDELQFNVWNRGAIPDPIARRIFQRHFSSKPGAGRGLGTYAMKLFGEEFLGGRVSFETSPAAGTVFRLALPIGRESARAVSSPQSGVAR